LRESVAMAGLNEHAVKINIMENLPAIFVDSHLLEQALNALLSNAAAYSSAKEPIEVSVTRDHSAILFSIADHGPGLAPGEEKKIFEKFYRGQGQAAGGLGLGLSIARQLVEAHSGEIVAQNRKDGGSRFSIRLPLREQMRLPDEATA
jgi:K+-sensing histidine kinase KdpD